MHFYSSFHSTEKNHQHIYISMWIQRKSPQQHKIWRKHANWWQSKPSKDVSNHLKCPTIVTFFITNCSNKLPCLPTTFISSQQRAKIIHNGWYEYISSSIQMDDVIHQSIAEERMEGSWRNQIEKSSNGKEEETIEQKLKESNLEIIKRMGCASVNWRGNNQAEAEGIKLRDNQMDGMMHLKSISEETIKGKL
jgi:hypothetical protein